MASGIGETLRVTRRQQRLSLAEAAAEIRVREPYLAALEEEKFAKLGGDVYVRAFLRGYSEFLGLDPDQIVDAYRREHERGGRGRSAPQEPPAELAPAGPAGPAISAWDETSAIEPARQVRPVARGGASAWTPADDLDYDDEEEDEPRGSFFPRAVTVAGVVLLMLVVAAVALRDRGDDQVAVADGGASEVAIPTVEATPVAEATPTPPPATTPPVVQPAPPPVVQPAPTPPPAQGPLQDINVELTVTDGPAWLRAEVDGSVEQVGISEPGTTFTWEAEESLVLRIGDASNVRLVLNGVDQGVLGGDRELRDLEYRIGQPA